MTLLNLEEVNPQNNDSESNLTGFSDKEKMRLGLNLDSPEFIPISQNSIQLKEDERNSSLKNETASSLNEELAIIKKPKKHFSNHQEREEFVKKY